MTLLALSMPWWWQPSRCDNAQHVVHIGRAAIHGLTTTVGDKSVRKYLGIRYAQPPTGLRRFQPPVPAELPVEVDASRYGARCPQLPLTNTAMSEDCLFLNVFAPHPPSGGRLPVFVWLHGGGFITGASDIYQGDVLAAEGRVVVVTLNYRLGALGFLSTGDNSSLGNYGLWDQRLALQWVQRHIRHFGGDERRVTLAGVSAGAASASIHSLTPLSRDLFRHVVQVSGSAASPWARVSASAALRAARVSVRLSRVRLMMMMRGLMSSDVGLTSPVLAFCQSCKGRLFHPFLSVKSCPCQCCSCRCLLCVRPVSVVAVAVFCVSVLSVL